MLSKWILIVLLLKALLNLNEVRGVEGNEEKVAKPRILISPPLSSFFNSHLLSMERLATFYADNGYEVYIIGMDFLETRRKTLNDVHLLTCPLLQPDNATERDSLMHQSSNFFEEKLRPIKYFVYIIERTDFECESIMSADNGRFFKSLRNYKFDLILHEFNCGLIIAKYLGIPNINVDNAGIAPLYRSFITLHLGSFPLQMLPYSSEMSLKERTINVVLYCMINSMLQFAGNGKITRLYNAQFKTNVADLSESYYNSSMLFINTRREFEYPIALMQNVLPIGGFFLKQQTDSSVLGVEINEFIKNQKVIYVSFGTLHEFATEEYDVLMKAFSQLKSYRILWQTRHKFASTQGAEHVRLVSWIDQPAILSSKETKLFIGHGGLNSALETAYYGVPYLVIPMLIDQFFNGRRVTVHKMGRYIYKEEMTESNLVELIQEMLNNPLYKRNAMKLARGMQFHDVKKDILYWTEMIIEHKGWPFLETQFKRLPWYSYFLLDVILVICVFLILMLLALVMCCRCMKRSCCRKATTKKKAE